MIAIIYIECQDSNSKDLCTTLKDSCSDVKLCLVLNGFSASWRELALAFINTVNAISSNNNIAQKPELEFFIRFYVERQIWILLERYLRIGSESKQKLVMVSYGGDNYRCVMNALTKIMESDTTCRFTYRPMAHELQDLYITIIKSYSETVPNLDFTRISKLALGIIGCGDILLKG